MEPVEQIKKFEEFIESTAYAQLLERDRKGEHFLILDFADLSKFDVELAELLLEQPEEVLKAAEMAIESFDLQNKKFTVRIKNLPNSQKILIRDIRSKDLSKLLLVEGTVRQKSDVRPKVTSAKFECPSCGSIMPILQLEKKFKEPNRCTCGRKGKFRLIDKELVDAQGLVLEEITEQLEGGEQPKRVSIFLKNDLVSPISDKKTNPGTKVRVVGQIKEVPIILRSGGQSTNFDLLIDANYIEQMDEDFSELLISEEEMKKIKELANDPKLTKKIVDSIAPSIYGHEKIKEALALMLVGGERKIRVDGVITRGDIHILLVGDPGSGKSQLLKRINIVAPKARYVSGKGASGAGLSASVVKDEFLQGWSLEAGAMVLANKGVCLIDELDKMNKDDSSALHEAMEQQQISISKANIQASLRCETTVLAAANPKWGRFDPYEPVGNQIEMPPTLINRFDLIFPIKDLPNLKNDEKMAKFILFLHQNIGRENKPEIDTILLRKYIAYSRRNIHPKLTDSATEELKEYYLKMRSSVRATEGNIKSIPITARQLEGLIRLTEANAKIRLSTRATKRDSRKAVELLDYCLRQVAFDEETGTIDIDRISTNIPATQRNRISIIKEIINELESKLGKIIPIPELMEEAEAKGIEQAETEEIVQKLKKVGDLFEPRRGYVSKI